MVGFFDVQQKEKKNEFSLKNKIKKRDEKTNPFPCKKPHMCGKLKKG